MHEIHAPAFGRPGRPRRRPAVQRHVLATPDAHPELQAVEAVQPSYPFPIHHPALPAQQHPDAIEPESRPRVRELLDAHPQCELLITPRPAVPGRSAELRQVTGPLHANAIRGHEPAGQLASADGP
jgi:hypothetical protein